MSLIENNTIPSRILANKDTTLAGTRLCLRELAAAEAETLQLLELGGQAAEGGQDDVVVAKLPETLLLRLAVMNEDGKSVHARADLLFDLLAPLSHEGNRSDDEGSLASDIVGLAGDDQREHLDGFA